MAHIGCCWLSDSELGPRNPNRGICLMLEASKKGHRGAQCFLSWEYNSDHYKKYCEEIQMFLIYEAMMAVLVNKGATKENYGEKLTEVELVEFNRMKNQGKKIEAVVTERAYLRTTSADFFWPKDEGPYEIDFQSILKGQN